MNWTWWLVALFITYAIAIIPAGHGMGPVGLLLFSGRAAAWVPGQLLGFGAITVLLLVHTVLNENERRIAIGNAVAALMLYASWAAFAIAALTDSSSAQLSSNVGALFLLSAPFQVATLALACTATWHYLSYLDEPA